MLSIAKAFFTPIKLSRPTFLQMSTAKEFTQSAISTNKIMVFSKTTCPYCIRAKKAIKDLNYDATIIELDVSDFVIIW